MKNKDDDASAQKNTKAEREANYPTQNWWNLVNGTFHDLFDRSWLQNLLIGIAILFVSPLIVFLLMRTTRGMLFGFGVGLTILFWIFWWTLIQRVVPRASASDKLDKQPTPALEATPTPNPTATPMSNTNISSVNQSGGFTGINQGTVNLGPQPRALTMDQGTRMARNLASQKATSPIQFWYVTGDEETNLYGQEIMALLKNGGFEFAEVNIAGMAAGIPSGLTIYVRDAKNPPSDAVRIADCFKSEGIQFNAREDGSLDANLVKIWVSIRPTL